MIGFDIDVDTLGGLTTVLGVIALLVGVFLLSGLYAILLWSLIVLLGAIVVYFGGRRLYRYLDKRFMNRSQPHQLNRGGSSG